jgi:flagellar basal-body rod protein FlgF
MGENEMDNALLIGLSRQMALSRALDVVANNVANVNTSGFKSDDSLFAAYLMPVARDNLFKGGDSQVSYVQDRATFRDFGQGALEKTGNPLDVAVNGPGFLTVQTSRGQRYTRNGSLQMNASGQLVTNQGDPVLGTAGPIVFQNGDHDINIAEDGTITVRQGTSRADSVRGKLQLVTFTNQQQLQKEGASLYVAPATAQPAADPKVRVVQGSVEKSNVNSVGAMTRLIEVTRSYTDVAGLIAQQSDLRKTAIDRLAQIPA